MMMAICAWSQNDSDLLGFFFKSIHADFVVKQNCVLLDRNRNEVVE